MDCSEKQLVVHQNEANAVTQCDGAVNSFQRYRMGSGITKPLDDIDTSSSVGSIDNEQYNDELAKMELEKELITINSITNTNFADNQILSEPCISSVALAISSRSSVEEHLSRWFEHTAGLEV